MACAVKWCKIDLMLKSKLKLPVENLQSVCVVNIEMCLFLDVILLEHSV